jgi:restriction endonuclease S subunit
LIFAIASQCRNRAGVIAEEATLNATRNRLLHDGAADQPWEAEERVEAVNHIGGFDPERWRRLKKSALSPGDVVVVRTGYPGTACVIPERLRVANGTDLVIIRPLQDIDSHYLCCFFNSTWGRGTVAGSLVGVAQQHFNIGSAKEMQITLPSKAFQSRIASILSAYDDLIENNTRRIKILEEMAQALYREWFVHFRFPGHEKVTMVPSPLGPIPPAWEVKRFTEAVAVSPRTIVPREGEKPFVPMTSLSNDSMLINDIESRTGNSGSKFVNGDTLFARITPCLENGKTAFVQFLPSPESAGFGSTEFIVLSEDSRRALSVVSETERTAKWVCPLPVLTHAALSQGERVDRDGAFTSRRGPGEGLVAGRGPIRQARPKLLNGNE